MRSLVRYAVLVLLAAGILAALLFTVHAPLIYSLEQDSFVSRYHDNTEVLKSQAVNSTTDFLPLMQDLLDYSGPITVNINMNNMDQVKRDLNNYAKYNKNLDNLIVKLDMSQSEIDTFAKSTRKQRELLAELANSSLSLEELKTLQVQYRDQNNPDMLVSVTIQQETIRKKIRELSAEYKNETAITQAIGKKNNLDITKTEESVKEVEKFVGAQKTESPLIQSPKLTLLLIPDNGQYLDTIDFSGLYYDGNTVRNNYPIVLSVDNRLVAQITTGKDGIYHSAFRIEQISTGLHTVSASSGALTSGTKTLTIKPANSVTSLIITRINDKPEIQCTGKVIANKPVQNAPVAILTDSRTVLPITTKNDGTFQTRIRLSSGIHRVQAQFMNTTYPISSSKSRVYEIEAGSNAISSIRLLDTAMSVDDISLAITPTNGTYKDNLNFTGILTGSDPKQKRIDVFIDDALYRTMLTDAIGSFTESYPIEKMRAGNHTVFIRYSEPNIGEIYSESLQFIVHPVDSVTTLHIEMTGNGTRLTCTGNVTANAHGVSSAPVEIVWDDRNVINIRTDAIGSFRQSIALPAGNHSIYARFASVDYPVKASRSGSYPVTIVPAPEGLSLEITPASVTYKDRLTLKGALISSDSRESTVDIFLDNRFVATTKTDRTGQYSYQITIEQIPNGKHTVQVRTATHSSGVKSFQVLLAESRTSITIEKTSNSSIGTCNGSVMAFGRSGNTIRKPGNIPEVLEIIATLGRDPFDAELIPVSSAPVLVIVNNRTLFESYTDQTGKFSTQVTLPQEDCTITARFMNESYPLLSSQSAGIVMNRPSTVISPAPVIRKSLSNGFLLPAVAALILILFAGGAYIYLNRRSIFVRSGKTSAEKIPGPEAWISPDITQDAVMEPDLFIPPVPQPEEDPASVDPILLRYHRILHAQGLSTAAREVYLHFTGQIAQKLQIHCHRALTPREFLRSCNKRPVDNALAPFIAIYEEIRYGGAKSRETEEEFNEMVKTTEKSLGDDDH
ncbi:DUF4129 domain-containing protein [Methanoregula sp.]|uniref:DUF4129 domain-containing protein n=1 Tax=Methanoregula sp. TaxID=2052170 RepID=UPI003568CAA3